MQQVRKSLLFLALATLVLSLLAAISLTSVTVVKAYGIEEPVGKQLGTVLEKPLDDWDKMTYSIDDVLTEPTRPGYRFEGWYTDIDRTDKVTDLDSVTSGTVYAKWAEKTIAETYNAQSDTYEIYTYNQLYNIRDLAKFNPIYSTDTIEKDISLCANIDFPSDGMWSTITARFIGTFNGNGHIINNFRLTTTYTGNYGLFSRIEQMGVVKNLTFANIDITSSAAGSNIKAFVGTIAGTCYGTISNCRIESGTIKANMYNGCVGAFAGVCDMGTIKNCISGGGITISGNATLGGIAGQAQLGADIISCTNYATISYAFKTESKCAGGIAGKIITNATIQNCVNYGLVKYSGNYSWNSSIRPCMAQIVGWNESGHLKGNEYHKECEYKNLTTNQRKYCSFYEVGRIGE